MNSSLFLNIWGKSEESFNLQCSDKIFYGEKRKGFHPHPLMLRVRQSWKCDVCQRTFADKCSFFCQQCDFDACDQCYLAY